MSVLFCLPGVFFGLGSGWATGPWIPLLLFGYAAGGFVWMDRPRETWFGIGLVYVALTVGIVLEAGGWVPHAFVINGSPMEHPALAVWWHVLIGGHTLLMALALFVVIRYVVLRWKRSERAVAERNRLLHHMFGRYMSAEVVRTLLDDPDQGLSLGGEQREVTLLMSGLRGFTALAERLEPTAVIALLNDYFEVMVDVCLDHRGTINEIVGDTLLIVFGAPDPCDDHADRAMACALAMQRAMETVNARNRARGRPVLEMGIGLNTGPVVVGNIGSSKRTKYGVVGSTVNRTARIESYTAAGQVLASASVRARAGRAVDVGEPFTVRPKGGEPIEIAPILGIAAAPAAEESRPVEVVAEQSPPPSADQPRSIAALWDRFFARATRLPLVDRALVACLFVLSGFPALIGVGAGVDPVTDPTFRAGWYEGAYALICVCCAIWVVLTGWAFYARRRGRLPRGGIAACLMLYTFQSTLFALGIGWNTSPWLPMVLFGAACAGFIWLDSPRATWASLAVSYVVVGAGIVAEAMGWVPHAFILARPPNQDGVVAAWWLVLVGAQTIIATGLLFPMVTYVLRAWKAREPSIGWPLTSRM